MHFITLPRTYETGIKTTKQLLSLVPIVCCKVFHEQTLLSTRMDFTKVQMKLATIYRKSSAANERVVPKAKVPLGYYLHRNES